MTTEVSVECKEAKEILAAMWQNNERYTRKIQQQVVPVLPNRSDTDVNFLHHIVSATSY